MDPDRSDITLTFTGCFPQLLLGLLHDVFLQVCSECAEEFCSGTCKNFQYDSYQRLVIQEKEKDQVSIPAIIKKLDCFIIYNWILIFLLSELPSFLVVFGW